MQGKSISVELCWEALQGCSQCFIVGCSMLFMKASSNEEQHTERRGQRNARTAACRVRADKLMRCSMHCRNHGQTDLCGMAGCSMQERRTEGSIFVHEFTTAFRAGGSVLCRQVISAGLQCMQHRQLQRTACSRPEAAMCGMQQIRSCRTTAGAACTLRRDVQEPC